MLYIIVWTYARILKKQIKKKTILIPYNVYQMCNAFIQIHAFDINNWLSYYFLISVMFSAAIMETKC